MAWNSKSEKCKELKKDKRVKSLHVKRWEKGNKTDSYWVMLLMHINSIETFCHTKTWASCYFVKENYTWTLDIVYIFFLIDFLDILSQNILEDI